MSSAAPEHRPDGARTAAPPTPLNEELSHQQDQARRRAEEREEQRRATEAKLREPDGLVEANDPVRVAKRLDRVTRYLAGGDPLESPADAPAEVLVESAMERATEVLEAPQPVDRDGYRGRVVDRGLESLPPAPDGERAAPETILLERIINTADFVSVRYLDAGVLAQHSVGRVNIRDDRGVLRGYGTGFLVSPALLLTNHHVLPDERTARTSIIEFNYQDGVDGKPLLPEVHPFAPDRFFVADRELDFALVAVDAPPEVLAGYGYNYLTAAQGTVIIGESVTIVQHPRGEKKQIALRENRIIDIPEQVVHYAADTEPGSSGSPVFNDQWEVVALHHASVPTPERAPEYTFLNEGIRISRILSFLATADLTPERRALVDALATKNGTRTSRAGGNGLAAGTNAPSQTSPPQGSAVPTSALQAAKASAADTAAPHAATTAQHATVPAGTVPTVSAESDGTPSTFPAGDGSVTLEVPLRITIQLGPPALAPPAAVPSTPAAPAPASPAPASPAVAAGRAPTTSPPPSGPPPSTVPVAPADDRLSEAISIDPDYSNRSGYDPDFLGTHLPLPGVDEEHPELRYHHFSVVMDRRRRLARVAAVNIDGAKAPEDMKRESDRWILDPRLPREEQTGEAVYADNDLDRGHLVRRLDPAWGRRAKAANDDTFHFTNCAPQHHGFNTGRDLWLGLEDYVLRSAQTEGLTVSVLSGPVLADGDPEYRGVALPLQFFKLAAMRTTAGGLSVTAYLLSQEALLDEFETGAEEFSFGAYRTFQVPVRRVGDLTGMDLTAYVAGDPLERLEATSLPREIVRPDDIILT